MGIKPNNSFSRFTTISRYCFLILVVVILYSCSDAGELSSTNMNITQVAIELATETSRNTETIITISPTGIEKPTVTKDVVCESKLIQVETEQVSRFFWADDGQSLYYSLTQNTEEYWSYDVRTGTTRRADKLDFPGIPSSYQSLNNIKIPKEHYDLFVSPSAQNVIFTLEANGNTPIPTSSHEVESSHRKLLLDVFMAGESIAENQYIGRIEGKIMDVHWSEDERQVIFNMGYFSPVDLGPAYMWRMNLVENNLSPIFLRAEEPHIVNFRGYSPDGEWVLYNLLGAEEKNVHALNIKTNDRKAINLAAESYFWWLPGRDILLVVGPSKDNSESIAFFYDFISGEILTASEETIIYNPWILDPIKPSPDYANLAFLGLENKPLSVLSLCGKP